MLGDFIYSEDAGSVPASEAPQKIENAVKRFLTLAIIFVGGGLIWIFAISPCMVPVKIDVSGFPGFEKADALRVAGLESGAPYVSINAEETQYLLSQHHLVESARVIKRFPDRLSIFLEPRRAVASAFVGVGGRTLPVYLDRQGVVFQIGGSAGDAAALMPVVSGLFSGTQTLRPGMQLPAAYQPLFSRIGAIGDEDPGIWQAISEIGIARKDNELFDLVLYPIHDPVRLRMGSEISKDSIYYALLMLDVCRQFEDIPEEIDVRSGLGVLKAKEGNLGK